jgi:hypothetical protein
VALLAYKVVYALYLDPLSKIPGPKINALSRIPYVRHHLAGTTVPNVNALHKKYGDVVRISPNEVSFISVETAYPEIYGFRTRNLKGHETMQKDRAWYAPAPKDGVVSIILANDADHSRGRRLLSHAFSERALAEQEVLIQKYVDQFIGGLKEVSSSSVSTERSTATGHSRSGSSIPGTPVQVLRLWLLTTPQNIAGSWGWSLDPCFQLLCQAAVAASLS